VNELVNEYILEAIDGTKVIDTRHSFDRGHLRKGNIRLLSAILLNHYNRHKDLYEGLKNVEFFFYVESLNQGMIVTYRKDRNKKYPGYHFVVVTIYPEEVPEPKNPLTPIVIA
jgi:hypothetical protein